jgi:Ribbon-helix-helix protein, copG family
MAMTRTTISFTREGMQLIQEAAKRQGSSVSQFVREAALMRGTMAADGNPYPMRTLAAQLRAIGDQGYALAEKALKAAEDEAERKR